MLCDSLNNQVSSSIVVPLLDYKEELIFSFESIYIYLYRVIGNPIRLIKHSILNRGGEALKAYLKSKIGPSSILKLPFSQQIQQIEAKKKKEQSWDNSLPPDYKAIREQQKQKAILEQKKILTTSHGINTFTVEEQQQYNHYKKEMNQIDQILEEKGFQLSKSKVYALKKQRAVAKVSILY